MRTTKTGFNTMGNDFIIIMAICVMASAFKVMDVLMFGSM